MRPDIRPRGQPAPAPSPRRQQHLYYDPNNDQLEHETTADANIFYTYNDNGSLIEEANDAGPLRTYTYNYLNRLASVAVGGRTVNYTYNADGMRTRAKVNGADLDYLIDPFNQTGYAQALRSPAPPPYRLIREHQILHTKTAERFKDSISIYAYTYIPQKRTLNHHLISEPQHNSPCGNLERR